MRQKKPSKGWADRLVTAYAILHDAKCTTCGVIRADLQPGHFFSRVCQSVRWDLRNVACQCPGCNKRHELNHEPLRRVMVKRLGEDGLERLERASNVPFPQPDMEPIIVELQRSVQSMPRFHRLSTDLQSRVLHGSFTNRELVTAIHGAA